MNVNFETLSQIPDIYRLLLQLNEKIEKVKAEIRKVGEQEQNIFKKLMNMYKL